MITVSTPPARVLWRNLLLASLGLTITRTSLAQFTTIINVPPDPAPMSIGSNTQLNLGPGGSLGNSFQAGAADGSSTNVEVNISGGTVGHQLFANAGSKVNITGGEFGVGLTAKPGSVMNIHAGPMTYYFTAENNSDVNFYGADFQLDGVPVAGLDQLGNSVQVPITIDSVLTGTLTDGMPFVVAARNNDYVYNATMTLHRTSTPPIGPPLIFASSGAVPKGIRQGQKLVVDSGQVDWWFGAGPGSSVDVQGGLISPGFEAIGADVRLSSGEIGNDVGLINGTRFVMTGGELGSTRLIASDATISGGTVDGFFVVHSGSMAEILGGQFNQDFAAVGTVDFAGGTVLGNVSVQGGTFDLSGGNLAHADFVHGTLNVAGGTIGTNPSSTILSAASLNLSDGSVGDNFVLVNGTRVGVGGGALGDHIEIQAQCDDCVVSVSGGSVGGYFTASRGTVNISGGTFGDAFHADDGSSVNFYGTQFLLGGQPIPQLMPGEPLLVSQRDVTLSGFLADGAPFSFDLNSSEDADLDYFSQFASVWLTLVTGLRGDYNGDNVVDAADYVAWRESLGLTVPNGTGADGDFSGIVDELDNVVWRRNFGSSAALGAVAVPEPTAQILLLLGALLAGIRLPHAPSGHP